MVRLTRESSNRIFSELLEVRDLIQSMETEERISRTPKKQPDRSEKIGRS